MANRAPRKTTRARLILRWARRTVFAFLVPVVVVMIVRLHAIEPAATLRDDSDAIAQLRFLDRAIDRGADEEMQRLFPEGSLFTNALHGLAWLDVGRRTRSPAIQEHALERARSALRRMESKTGRRPFPQSLAPPHGAFWSGWTARLRAGILSVTPKDLRTEDELLALRRRCDAIAAALRKAPSPFLESYGGAAWPCDTVVAVAALRMYDTLAPPRYGADIERWIHDARARADPDSGLLSHAAEPSTGVARDVPRGSSQSLLLPFLMEIDPEWGRASYVAFREQYVDSVLGVPGVREFPRGSRRRGDIDSGPLLFGISASATVVAVRAARVNGDEALAVDLLTAVEVGGVPLGWDGERCYGLGLLPVADAFLAWARAAPSPSVGAPAVPPSLTSSWRLWWSVAAIVILVLLAAPDLWKHRAENVILSPR